MISSVQGDHSFYQYMPPELKSKLIFTLLNSYYRKFFFFFNDVMD